MAASTSRNLPRISYVRRRIISRAALVMATWVYAYAIFDALVKYLVPFWGYFGFSYRPPTVVEVMLIVILVTIVALLMPFRLSRASSVMVLMLFLVVFVPTTVISFCLDADRVTRYGPALLVLGLSFSIACISSRLPLRRKRESEALPGSAFSLVILALWVIACVILLLNYWSVMTLVSLEDVYGQRSAGASTNISMGYLQTYFVNVLSPTLIALGLLRRRLGLVALGAAGCLIMYMIAAQRTVILLPMAIIGVYAMLTARSWVFRTTALPVLVIAVVIMLSVAYWEESLVASLMSMFLVHRTIAVPGLAFPLYYDVFSVEGFTWWSHVRGLGLLIPGPSKFVNDPLWPGLGYIIGDRVYGSPGHNYNASLFSQDGIAAAGAVGVLIIGLLLSVWLYVLDRVTRGWNQHFTVLVMLPIAVSLTNGSLFTTLLSFGGLFWLVVFALYKPDAHCPELKSKLYFIESPPKE